MKIKLQDIKKVNALTLLVVGFTVGAIAMSLFYQPKFLSQQQAILDLANKPTPTPIPPFQYDVSKAVNAGYSYYDVMKYIEQNEASHSAIEIINVPDTAPTPIIEYRTQTQYVQEPADTGGTTNCRPDYIGGMYCTSDTGVQTHCRSNYAGGMICN